MDQEAEPSRRELFRYIIASGEMRYIERTERLLYLEKISEGGWIVRGVIPGCGPTCDSGLGQVIVEFIMSCGGLAEETLQAALRVFAQKNAASIVESIGAGQSELTFDELVDQTLHCLFGSLGGEYEMRFDERSYSTRFDNCPLCNQQESGLPRNAKVAHEVLLELVRAAIYKLDPAATVRSPGEYSTTDHPLQIEIIRPIG